MAIKGTKVRIEMKTNEKNRFYRNNNKHRNKQQIQKYTEYLETSTLRVGHEHL